MGKRTRWIALAGMPALSLLTSMALAAEIPLTDIDNSAIGVTPEAGELKNQNDCRGGTYFKNFVPGLTNGSGGGTSTVPIIVDGKAADITIEWGPSDELPENSFGFSLNGAYALEVGVTTNTNNFTYDYRSDAVMPVMNDSNLNKLRDDLIAAGEVIADVNHLDLCLAGLDEVDPFVSIDAPPSGATVSGIVNIVATIRDNEGLLDVKATVSGGSLPAPFDLDNPVFTEPDQYVWTWDTSQYDAGIYTLTVLATDTSILVNQGSDYVIVEVVRSIADCRGVIGDEDFTNPTADPFGGGCSPSIITIQAAPDYDPNCVGYDQNEPCTISGELLEGTDTSYCGPGAFRDPRMQFVGGRWVPEQPLRELVVFQELGGAPVISTENFPNGAPIDALVLDEFTYGYRGCFGVVFHYKNFPLINAYPVWPQFPLTGLVFVKTVFPDEDWADPNYPNRQIAGCYGDGGNFDLQEAAEFAYQTDDKALMIEGLATPYTNECSSSRTLTRNKSFEIFNLIETAGIDFGTPTGQEDVLEFKYQIAAEKFQALFAALDNAQPTILTGRFSAVTSKVNQAKRQFENMTSSSLDRAIGDLRDASDVIKAETTWFVQEENWPGDALGRLENLIYRLGLLKAELER